MTQMWEDAQCENDIDYKVLRWNWRMLRLVGLWPFKNNNVLCASAVVYMFLHCCACLADILFSVGDVNCIQAVLEFIIFSISTGKLVIYRLQSSILRHLIAETRRDFSRDNYNYNTDSELMEVLKYNSMSKLYVKITLTGAISAAVFYFFTPILVHIADRTLLNRNSSLTVLLPLRGRYPFEIKDIGLMYALLYLYHALILATTVVSYIGTDCLLATLILHLCGQYANLACKIEEELGDSQKVHGDFHQLLLKHQRLIGMSNIIDKSFNAFLLYQIFSLTFLLCFLWYKMITGSNEENYTETVAFTLAQNGILVSVFGYCFIGQCLIHESLKVAEALYSSGWYAMPLKNLKSVHIWILRSQHPIVLTAGRCVVFSFSTFAEIIKLSVSYLSFLRKIT